MVEYYTCPRGCNFYTVVPSEAIEHFKECSVYGGDVLKERKNVSIERMVLVKFKEKFPGIIESRAFSRWVEAKMRWELSQQEIKENLKKAKEGSLI